LFNLIGYVVSTVNVNEVNNPIESQVNLTGEVIPVYIETANAVVQVSSEVTTVFSDKEQ
jgi:hypothetical protein